MLALFAQPTHLKDQPVSMDTFRVDSGLILVKN